MFLVLMKQKIVVELTDKEFEEHSAFGAGRSIIDNIFNLKLLIEKKFQRNFPEAHLVFIDLEK